MRTILSMCAAAWLVTVSSAALAAETFEEIVVNGGYAFSRVDEDTKKVEVYDVVAAYDDHTTVAADCDRFTASFKSASWCFSSEANRKKFEAAAKERINRYIPFGGGYCARGLSNGNFAKGDPRTHVRAGPDLILNGSWEVSSNFFDDLSARRAAGRIAYALAKRTGILTPNQPTTR